MEPIAQRISSRWKLNPQVLYEARIARELTQKEAGALCGWSKGFQCKLENGYKDYVTDHQLKRITSIFPELKVLAEE